VFAVVGLKGFWRQNAALSTATANSHVAAR